MIEVDRFGAFTVNRVGLAGAAFPLSITVSEAAGVWTARGTAIRAVDVVDTLVASAGLFAAVLNLGQSAWFGDGLVPLAAGEIAARQGVAADVHDISWSGPRRAYRIDLLALPWADLGRLFADWSLYQVDIVDLGDDLAGFSADELALTAGISGRDQDRLQRLGGARVWYTGHDDCYFQVDSTDQQLPARLLARLLALLAGSTMLDDQTPGVLLSEPATQLAAELLAVSCQWTATPAAAAPGEPVTIKLAADCWQPGRPLPGEVVAAVMFDLSSGHWNAEFLSPR